MTAAGAPPGERRARDVVVRSMGPQHVDAVAAIERSAFSSPWKPETFRGLVGRPDTDMLVLESPGGEVVGYAVLWSVTDQGELANIAVVEDWRGLGLGGRLLAAVLDRARIRGVERLYLEVRESNERAAAMYLSRGFEEIGRRRDYYDAPREDARVLVKRLDTNPTSPR